MRPYYNKDARSFSDFLYALVTDYKKMGLFILLIISIALTVTLSLYIGMNFFTNKTNSIEIKESGAMIINLNSHVKTASYLLSSNGNNSTTPWINTNIDVEEGDRITFYISGKICTGIHKMIDAANKNTIMPPIPWSGPEGIICNNNNQRDKEEKRKKYLISTKHNQGQIIGIISNSDPSVRPNPEDIIDINKYTTESYIVTKNKGHIWLTINEVFLDDATLNRASAENLSMDKSEYQFIKKNHYANVWYDDNSGFFSINMEISKKRFQ